jgi:hypothetical protein
VRSRRADIYIYLSAAAAMALVAPAGPLYWDSSSYVVQAINGHVGGLGFGRPVFILVSHVLARCWFAIGGSAGRLEPVLRIFWSAVSCTTAPLTWRLARRAALTVRASAMAGLAVAVSPAMAHSGGAVLTDGPATAACVLAGLLALEAVLESWDARFELGPRALTLAAAAGAATGLAIGLREQSLFSLGTLALMLPIARRGDRWPIGLAMAAGAAAVVAAPMLFVWLTEPGYLGTIQTWLVGMARDRAAASFGWHDAPLFALWIAALGPVIAYAAVSAWGRRGPMWRSGGALFAVAAPSLVQLGLAPVVRGISYSPRFLLPTLPGALAIPGSWAIDRWIGASRLRFAAATVGIAFPLVVAAPLLRARSAPLLMTFEALPSMLAGVPRTAVIVTGQPCPVIALERAIIAHDSPSVAAPDWQAVCPGWAWPSDLAGRLDAASRDERAIVLDLRPTSWIGTEQQSAFAEVQRYAQAIAPRADARRVIIWR